jgi:hypothetical protein
MPVKTAGAEFPASRRGINRFGNRRRKAGSPRAVVAGRRGSGPVSKDLFPFPLHLGQVAERLPNSSVVWHIYCKKNYSRKKQKLNQGEIFSEGLPLGL